MFDVIIEITSVQETNKKPLMRPSAFMTGCFFLSFQIYRGKIQCGHQYWVCDNLEEEAVGSPLCWCIKDRVRCSCSWSKEQNSKSVFVFHNMFASFPYPVSNQLYKQHSVIIFMDNCLYDMTKSIKAEIISRPKWCKFNLQWIGKSINKIGKLLSTLVIFKVL